MIPLLIPAIAFTLGALFVVRRVVAGARRSVQRLADTTAALDADGIRALADECVAEFRDRLGIELDLADGPGSAARLDVALKTPRTLVVLSRGTYSLRAVELAGAFLAELVRRNADAEWRMDGGSPRLLVRRPDGEAEVWPFLKAFKHVQSGTAGDLVAWVLFLLGAPLAGTAVVPADGDGGDAEGAA